MGSFVDRHFGSVLYGAAVVVVGVVMVFMFGFVVGRGSASRSEQYGMEWRGEAVLTWDRGTGEVWVRRYGVGPAVGPSSVWLGTPESPRYVRKWLAQE